MPVPGAVSIALGAWKCSFVWSWVPWEEPCRNCCLFHLQLYAWNYLRFNQMLLVTGCTYEISWKGFYCGTEQGLKSGLESLLCSNLLWWSHSERSWCESWIPVLGLPWFGVEAEGGQDLAGLSLSSLQWVERSACVADQAQSKGVTVCWPLGCHGLTIILWTLGEILCCSQSLGKGRKDRSERYRFKDKGWD